MKFRNKYKRNLQILLWTGFLFLFLGYKLAYKKTIKEFQTYKNNSAELILLQDAPLQIQIIENKLKEIEKILGSSTDQSVNPQGLLLEYANNLPSGSSVIINELPKSNSIRKDGFFITNQEIVFQGPFMELLKLLRSLEKEKGIGNICSVSFFNQKEGRSSSIYLKMKISFQSIKPEQ